MNQQRIDNVIKKKSIKGRMLDTFKKPFSYIGLTNEKYHFYSPISEISTTVNTETDSLDDGLNIPSTEDQLFNNSNNNIQSDPSKLLYVPKSVSSLNDQVLDKIDFNKDNNQMNENKNDDNHGNNYNNNDNTDSHVKSHNSSTSYMTSSSLSKMNQSKKLLLPQHLEKRQTAFSKADINDFYNSNQCCNYEKYENYNGNNKKTSATSNKKNKSNNADISLDKNAIELQELHFNRIENNGIDNQNQNDDLKTYDQDEENSERIVEKEIAKKINGISLSEVHSNTESLTNVLSNNTIINDVSSYKKNNHIETNVTFEFKKDTTNSVLSNNIYPEVISNNEEIDITSISPAIS